MTATLNSQPERSYEPADVDSRAGEIFAGLYDRVAVRTDRMFALLMALQWLGGVLAAVWVSPQTWSGSIPSTHIHVWSAIICGGLISAVPIYLALVQPGKVFTRYTIAVAQMLWSALLIHLTGGRIETHFHVFGSLAFLAVYRDWRVLVPATIVIALDHGIRGIFWPQSVYGVLSASAFRTVEHAAWVVFEDIFLFFSCRDSMAEMHRVARQRAQLEQANVRTEAEVRRRTEQLQQNLAWKASVLDAAADGIITVDEHGTILEFNSAAEKIFQRQPSEMIGRSLFLLMSEATAAEHQDYFKGFRETGVNAVVGERREALGLRADGTVFPIELQVTEVAHGGRTSFTGLVRDLTEQKLAEEALARANEELRALSRHAGMAEVATGVLHNVGNVLNSVNVSATLAADKIRTSRVSRLAQATTMINEHTDDLGTFLTSDERGKQLPAYLGMLAQHLVDEQAGVLHELQSLTDHIDHIKNIVKSQQKYAGVGGLFESVPVLDLLEDALRFNATSLQRHDIVVHKDFNVTGLLETDKQRVLQILVNLIRNAKQALAQSGRAGQEMTMRSEAAGDVIRLEVSDNGVGIAPENLAKIFAHGFTTKKDGHGFGLHHSALAAKELGGALKVRSDGLGRGATFILELPRIPVEATT
jgi:hypothetical protein